jgi:hypothetical protein
VYYKAVIWLKGFPEPQPYQAFQEFAVAGITGSRLIVD